jgi:hypothetical protein
MEDIEDIMKMMAKVEVPAEMKARRDFHPRVSNHEEDMLSIKNAQANWQYGKIVNVFD